MTVSMLVDLVKCYTPTVGQGALTLGPAVPGFLTPSTVIPAMTSGAVVSYGISDPSGNEVGQGTLTLLAGVWSLTRGVTQSSNGGAPINCTGQAVVALTLRSEDLAGTNAVSGITRLGGAAVSSPVAYIDIPLPAGYSSFRILFTAINFSRGETLTFAVSTDGGATFFNDPVNFDTYGEALYGAVNQGANAVAAVLDGNQSFDALCYVQSQPILGGVDADVGFYPGDGTHSYRATISGVAEGVSMAGPDRAQAFGAIGYLNPKATHQPSYAAVNYLRFLPYGNGDCDPPTSGVNIVSGSYILWGLN